MAKQRYHYFKGGDGRNVVYDRESQLYYDRDTGLVKDPITGDWKDASGKPKKPSSGEQLGSAAANIAGTAAGTYVAYNTPGWLGYGNTAKDVAQTTNTATQTTNAANAANTANTAAQGANTANTATNAANTANVATTTTGAGNGILGANGATLGSAGVGLAGAGVGAYYGYAANQALGHVMSDDPEKKKRGYMESALLATGPFLGWASPLVSPIDEALGSGKDKDQQTRDWARKNFEKTGLTKDNKLTLADGSQFDVGLDGGARLSGPNGERRQFDVDFNDPRAAQTVADLDPLGAIFGAGNEKLKTDNTGYFANAALSSGDPRANTLKMYADVGFTDAQSVIAAIDALVEKGKIKKEMRDIYANSANNLFSGQAPAAPAPGLGGMGALGASASAPAATPQVQTLPNAVAAAPTQQQIQQIGGMASLGATGRKPVKRGEMTYL